MQLSNNGYLSFGSTFEDATPESFPISTALIAPFWTDLFESNVWYRVTTNNDIIQRVSEDVASAFPELTTFSATEVLIVTWDNVEYRCSGEEVSFNFILTKTKYLVWIKITSLLILRVLEINTKVYNPNLPNHLNILLMFYLSIA